MTRYLPALSRGMLIIGVLLIVAGLGWALWARANQPPEPVITEAGAVVMAVTAQIRPATATLTPTEEPAALEEPTVTASQPPSTGDPTPDLLPDWTVTPAPEEARPTEPPATPLPPTPTPPPTPTSPPPAEKPPTRIVAPSIEMDVNVVPMGWEQIEFKEKLYTKWVVPEKAAGWHKNSALPGTEENVVLSGHHNIGSKVFRYVVDLNPGDELQLYVDDMPYLYYVAEKYILKEAGMPMDVRRANAQWIQPSGDERLTLVTCWPYEWPGNTHRVVVVARPAGYFQELSDEARDGGVE